MYKGIFWCYRKEFVLGNEVMSSVKNRFFVEEFEKTGIPPKRECWYGYDDPRAQGCPMRDACYKDCGKYE